MFLFKYNHSNIRGKNEIRNSRIENLDMSHKLKNESTPIISA